MDALPNDAVPKAPRQLLYQKMANSLRSEILGGKYPPGSKLPSTQDFAVAWKSNYFTVYTALKTLAKEGWVERIHGHGTYVVDPNKRFLHAAIFHSLNIWSDEEATFQRRLNDCLVEKFQALNKTTQIIIDSRPESEQHEMFPPLADVISNRQIDCVVAPDVNSRSLPLLARLSIPVAFMTGRPMQPSVNFDEAAFIRGSLSRLAEQGCRSVGFITNTPPIDRSMDGFVNEVQAAGLTTRDEWLIQPPEFQSRLAEYGYHAFGRLHRLPERPEGLVVYPDVVARGVILAALQSRTRIPEEMKVVFHRNANAQIICPFPVTWAVSDENAVAEGLIQTIQKQFAGERPKPIIVSYTFEQDNAQEWQI